MKHRHLHLMLLLLATLLLPHCRGCLSPHQENRVEILSIEPEWLNVLGKDTSRNCHNLRQTKLGYTDSFPDVIGLKLHVRFFSDLSDTAAQYHKVYGADGMLDTLRSMRIGIAHADSTTTWLGETDWEKSPYSCTDVIHEKPRKYNNQEIHYHTQSRGNGYPNLRTLTYDLNRNNNMPYTTFPGDKQNWIRILLFPSPADTIPAEGRLVVKLDFASGRRLVGRSE